MGAIRLSVSYAARQIYAQTTAAAAVTLVVLALSRNTVGDARQLMTQANLVALIALMVAAAIVDTVVGWVNVHPTFKWYAAGENPTPQQQRAAMRIAPRQTIIQFTTWAVSALVYTLLNLDAGGGVAYVMGGCDPLRRHSGRLYGIPGDATDVAADRGGVVDRVLGRDRPYARCAGPPDHHLDTVQWAAHHWE